MRHSFKALMCLCVFSVIILSSTIGFSLEALAEYKQIGPNSWEYSMEGPIELSEGLQIVSADVVQTIGSSNVGDTISLSVSLFVLQENLPLDYIAQWDLFINNEYITTAGVWSRIEKARLINYTSTVEYTGSIECIYCLAQLSDMSQTPFIINIWGEHEEEFQPAPFFEEQAEERVIQRRDW